MAWSGDNETTNALASEPGFPIDVKGVLVSVIAHDGKQGGPTTYHATDGRVFMRQPFGGFVEVDADDEETAP